MLNHWSADNKRTLVDYSTSNVWVMYTIFSDDRRPTMCHLQTLQCKLCITAFTDIWSLQIESFDASFSMFRRLGNTSLMTTVNRSFLIMIFLLFNVYSIHLAPKLLSSYSTHVTNIKTVWNSVFLIAQLMLLILICDLRTKNPSLNRCN